MTYPKLPPQYRWLTTIGQLPRMLDVGLQEFGTIETPGPGNTTKIMDWADEVGVGKVYTADAIPWCGLFMALCATRAGRDVASSPLWALSWSNWGKPAGQPRLADVLTFTRNGGGHVCMYIGEDGSHYHVFGGNQSDAVCFTRIPKERLHSVRRAPYRNPPASVRPFMLDAVGMASVSEA